MTLENGYVILRGRYQRLVNEANQKYMRSGSARDLERLEYLEGRLKRYTL